MATEPAFLTTPQGRRIAYRRTPGAGLGVVFLGGFRSDMEGTKALHLEAWAQAAFEDGSIGDWVEDAAAVIAAQTEGPQILVGSSMGGWIALLLARAYPGRVAGLVGIAAAPDFTEDSVWAEATPDQRAQLRDKGFFTLPSDYSDAPYVFTRRLIEDGRRNLVLRAPLDLPFPVRLLQGTDDSDVPVSVALRLMNHATGADIRLTLVKGANHRFSTSACLQLVVQAVTRAD
jgi:pimeloyl-ACP methyl ester carboxylesterase